jgi:molecular chaperone HtpG
VSLQRAHEQRPNDDDLAATAELIYGTAVLAEGGELRDPTRFSRLLADRLERTL